MPAFLIDAQERGMGGAMCQGCVARGGRG